MKTLKVRRRNSIRALLLDKGTITIDEITEKFGVSVETVRRDFDDLAKEGFLTKVYGGATIKKRTSMMPQRQILAGIFSAGKTRIAEYAASLIRDGDSIFLDSSEQVFYMCPLIMEKNITVLTNSPTVMHELSKSKTISLIGVGGRYSEQQDCFLGPSTTSFLRQFQLDRCFLTCLSFDEIHGLGSTDEYVADLKNTVVNCSEQVCLLADHSKFGKPSFARFGTLDDVDVLLTDEPISDKWKVILSTRHVEFHECLPQESPKE